MTISNYDLCPIKKYRVNVTCHSFGKPCSLGKRHGEWSHDCFAKKGEYFFIKYDTDEKSALKSITDFLTSNNDGLEVVESSANLIKHKLTQYRLDFYVGPNFVKSFPDCRLINALDTDHAIVLLINSMKSSKLHSIKVMNNAVYQERLDKEIKEFLELVDTRNFESEVAL